MAQAWDKPSSASAISGLASASKLAITCKDVYAVAGGTEAQRGKTGSLRGAVQERGGEMAFRGKDDASARALCRAR